MTVDINKVDLSAILTLRSLFLKENNFQIRYNACHERGWTDTYLITHNNKNIGYGSIKGNENIRDRDTIFEFYILHSFRNLASFAFAELLRSSGASFIECQSNEAVLTNMLYEYGRDINANVVLFEENTETDLHIDNIIFRPRQNEDIIFEHKHEPVGEYVLDLNNEVVATGGFALHYNLPFADLYMEVKEDHRKKGMGSYLIQELKKECYLNGRVPAARTGIDNIPSRATLLKAGLKVAGYMLLGSVK